jgi:two-component system, OmpR family, alkaline phosphatase synthesis response regulator PhoP
MLPALGRTSKKYGGRATGRDPGAPGRASVKDKTIVIVEDEEDILEVIVYNLEREGYRCVTTNTGTRGLNLVREEQPDLVILDLMLPGMNGLDICRNLKSSAETRDLPVIMVTARAEESDVVIGLGLGADDYIAKPFSPRELVARVQAVLRRGPKTPDEAADEEIEHGSLRLDLERHQVSYQGREVKLTVTEFKILRALAARPGRVYTRDQLITRALGSDRVVIDRNIDVHVRALRRKLGDGRDLIETVRGVGYRLSEES